MSNNSCESICRILTDGKSEKDELHLAYSPHLARLRQSAQFRLAMNHCNQHVNSEVSEICALRQSARAHVLLGVALATSLLMARLRRTSPEERLTSIRNLDQTTPRVTTLVRPNLTLKHRSKFAWRVPLLATRVRL